MIQRNDLDRVWGADTNAMRLIITSRSDEGTLLTKTTNILTVTGLTDLFDLYDALDAITINGKSFSTGLCKNYQASFGAATCASQGILSAWDWNRTTFNTSAASGISSLLTDINAATTPLGLPNQQKYQFSVVPTSKDSTGGVSTAAILTLDFVLNNDLSDAEYEDWYGKAAHVISDVNRSSSNALTVYYFTLDAVDRELAGMVSADFLLVSLVFVLIGIFFFSSIIARRDVVHLSRPLVGLVAFLCVAASTFGGLGLAQMFQIPYTSLSPIVPFILVGVGVDDMLLLFLGLEEVRAQQSGDLVRDPLALMVATMEEHGISLLATSVTNILSFGLVSVTDIPALRSFSQTVVLCIILDFLLETTLVVLVMHYWEGRVQRYLRVKEERKRDPSVSKSETEKVGMDEEVGVRASDEGGTSSFAKSRTRPEEESASLSSLSPSIPHDPSVARNSVGKDSNVDEPDPEKTTISSPSAPILITSDMAPAIQHALQWYFDRIHGPYLSASVLSVVWVVIFLGVLGAGIAGVVLVTGGLDISTLLRLNSTAWQYSKVSETLVAPILPQKGVLVFRDIDYPDESIQAKMLLIWDKIRGESWHVAYNALDDSNFWLKDIISAAETAGTATTHTFTSKVDNNTYSYRVATTASYPGLRATVASSASQISSFPPTNISSSYTRTTIVLPPTTSAAEGVKNMQSVRSFYTKWQSEFGSGSGNQKDDAFFIWQYRYIFDEGEAILKTDLATSLGIGLCGILFISIFLLRHPLVALLATVSTAGVILLLFLFLWLANIPLNTVSSIAIVISSGIVVDHVIHVVIYTIPNLHGDKWADRKMAARHALTSIGPVVLLGGFSNLLSLLPLVGSVSQVFQISFKLFCLINAGGLFVSLLFMPSVLPYFRLHVES